MTTSRTPVVERASERRRGRAAVAPPSACPVGSTLQTSSTEWEHYCLPDCPANFAPDIVAPDDKCVYSPPCPTVVLTYTTNYPTFQSFNNAQVTLKTGINNVCEKFKYIRDSREPLSGLIKCKKDLDNDIDYVYDAVDEVCYEKCPDGFDTVPGESAYCFLNCPIEFLDSGTVICERKDLPRGSPEAPSCPSEWAYSEEAHACAPLVGPSSSSSGKKTSGKASVIWGWRQAFMVALAAYLLLLLLLLLLSRLMRNGATVARGVSAVLAPWPSLRSPLGSATNTWPSLLPTVASPHNFRGSTFVGPSVATFQAPL